MTLSIAELVAFLVAQFVAELIAKLVAELLTVAFVAELFTEAFIAFLFAQSLITELFAEEFFFGFLDALLTRFDDAVSRASDDSAGTRDSGATRGADGSYVGAKS